MKQINCKYFWKIITLSNYNFKKILESLSFSNIKKIQNIYLKYYSTLSERILEFDNYEYSIQYITESISDHFSRFVIDKYGKEWYKKIVKNPNIIFKYKRKFLIKINENLYNLKLGNKTFYPKIFIINDIIEKKNIL